MSAVMIQVNARQMRDMTRLLRRIPRRLPLVTARALNKTGSTARIKVVRLIGKEIAVPQKRIKPSVLLRRASRKHLEARIEIRGRRIPLLAFGARQTRRGVTYKVSRSSGRQRIESAFIATMPSGHEAVMRRRTPAVRRLPIVELRGPSVPAVYEEAPDIARRTLADAGALLERNLLREIDYELSKAG